MVLVARNLLDRFSRSLAGSLLAACAAPVGLALITLVVLGPPAVGLAGTWVEASAPGVFALLGLASAVASLRIQRPNRGVSPLHRLQQWDHTPEPLLARWPHPPSVVQERAPPRLLRVAGSDLSRRIAVGLALPLAILWGLLLASDRFADLIGLSDASRLLAALFLNLVFFGLAFVRWAAGAVAPLDGDPASG